MDQFLVHSVQRSRSRVPGSFFDLAELLRPDRGAVGADRLLRQWFLLAQRWVHLPSQAGSTGRSADLLMLQTPLLKRVLINAPCRIRTCGPLLRRQLLYPAELRELNWHSCSPSSQFHLWLIAAQLQPMAASRLNDSQKQDLVERYRSGEVTSSLAQAFNCSPNTVSRIAKAMLSEDEYRQLKAVRARGGGSSSVAESDLSSVVADAPKDAEAESAISEAAADLGDEGAGPLALDDADDFGDDCEDELSEGDAGADDSEDLDSEPEGDDTAETFHVVPTLQTGEDLFERQQLTCKPLAPGVLPASAYLLVDKVVELDPRPLSDYPELGHLSVEEQQRQSLCLYANPRAAKRQCGRSQRVIKVPDTAVFECSVPYLLARGITRLVIEGSLVALDR